MTKQKPLTERLLESHTPTCHIFSDDPDIIAYYENECSCRVTVEHHDEVLRAARDEAYRQGLKEGAGALKDNVEHNLKLVQENAQLRATATKGVDEIRAAAYREGLAQALERTTAKIAAAEARAAVIMKPLEAHCDRLEDRLARTNRRRRAHFARSLRQTASYRALNKYVGKLNKYVGKLQRRLHTLQALRDLLFFLPVEDEFRKRAERLLKEGA